MAKKKTPKKKISPGLSIGFGSILAIVSIIGFLNITTTSFFNFTFESYMDFLWLFLIGIGFIIVSKPKKLSKSKGEPVTDITALVVGGLAIIAGILSLPFLGIEHPVFFAIKGVISVIAIIFIILEAWVLKK